jgi:hypothetical protein
MAETSEGVSTRAARRTPAKTTPNARKAAPKKAAASDATNATAFACNPAGETKTYAVFQFPEGSGCVGRIYVPKGTKIVKVRLEN